MKKNYGFFFGTLFAVLASSGLNAQTYTFTTATATGVAGPSQGMVDAEYTGTTLDGFVTVVNGIQYWEVPTSGNYSIEAFGAQGYGAYGGRGAQMYGEFFLNAGDTLKILVGQMGAPYLNFPATTYNHQFGGGGGSFVTTTETAGNVPYVVAGGGGGNHEVSYLTACDGQITTSGSGGAQGATLGAGGTAGSGGLAASSADGGGGLLGNGTGIAAGFAYVNGGAGGIDEGTGGFGGGGGTSSWNNYRGGGGGGYSGGGGGNNGATCCAAGGGGGSYNAGTNQNNVAGVQLGDGLVVVTSLCAPVSFTPDNASLADIVEECSAAMPTPPTATNSCGTVVDGVPDVTFPISASGTTVVTWTFDDGFTTITQTQNVMINDVTGPTPDLPSLADSTYWCSANSLVAPTATDNCSGSVVVTNDATFPITALGLTVVTWTYTDATGNTTTQTQNVTVDGPDDGVTQTGATLTSDQAGASYQWVDCDNGNAPVIGAVSQSFTSPVNGNFAVEVTFNGCTVTSACMLVDYTGLDEITANGVELYPNPSADGNFVVHATGVITGIEVFDAMGRKMEVGVQLSTGEVDGSALLAGKYLVRVTGENATFTKALVVIR